MSNEKKAPKPKQEKPSEPRGITYIVNGVEVDPNGEPVKG